jgi:hypothetical protein
MEEKRKNPAGSPFWQIAMPMILGGILIILLGVGIVLEVSPGNISRFAEISTVLLLIPYMGLSLIGALLLVGLIVLTVKIITGLPVYTSKLLELVGRLHEAVKKVSDVAVAPVIRPAAILGGLKGLWRREEKEINID